MKHRMPFVAALFFLSAAGSFSAQAADCKAMSGRLLDNLDQGHYAVAVADFDAKMKALLTPAGLQNFWETLKSQWGARDTRDDARLVQKNGNDIVVTPLHFGDKVANAVVVCSPAGQISGFHVFKQP